MKQNALTVIAPIKTDEADALERILTEIGNDVEGNPHVRFRDTPSTHFARWVILERRPKVGKCLLFVSNHDGCFQSYMCELVQTVGPGMEEVWSKCKGYPPGAAQDVARFTEFIQRHSVEHQAFYVALPGASVRDISNCAHLREMVNELLDRPSADPWVRQLPDLVPTPQAAGLLGRLQQLAERWLLQLFKLLQRLAGVRPGVDNPNYVRAQAREDVLEIEGSSMVQTPVTLVSTIKKPRFYHKLLLRSTLFVVNQVAQKTPPTLGGVSTIHFAHWAIINEGRHLLFETNFDGSWERYLDDFIDHVSEELDAVWANCENYPKGGAEDSEGFKRFFRDDHFPVQVYYSAYPEATVNNIVTDLQLGDAVKQFLRQEEVERFLGGSYAIGAGPPPTDEVAHRTRSAEAASDR